MNGLLAKCDICGKVLIDTDWKWYQDRGYHINCLIAEVVRLKKENDVFAYENDAMRQDLDAWEAYGQDEYE